MKPIYCSISAFAVALLVAAPASADPVADARAHSEAFALAVNAKDAGAVLALYTDDARVIWPGQGEEAKGKAEIAKRVASMITGRTTQHGVLVFKSQGAIPLGDDYVAAVCQWEQTFTAAAERCRSKALVDETVQMK